MSKIIEIIEVTVLIFLLKLRWFYFHVCPWYIKFSMGNEGADTEYHFQNMRTNTIHSNFSLKFKKGSIFYEGESE